MLVVAVTLAATMSIQTGYFLWKAAAPDLPVVGKAPLWELAVALLTNTKWVGGLLATMVGWLLFVKASDLGEVSVVQPLMSIGDLFLIVAAVVFLHERLARQEWVGLALTVVGAALLALEAKVVMPTGIGWGPLAALLGAVGLLGAVLVALSRRSGRPEVPLAVAVGCGFGAGAVLTELMTARGALSDTSLESLAGVFNPVLPFMIGANVIGLVLLQTAFQRGRAAVIVPVQLAVVNGIVVLAGVFVFAEAITATRLAAVALIALGTFILHQARRNRDAGSMRDGEAALPAEEQLPGKVAARP